MMGYHDQYQSYWVWYGIGIRYWRHKKLRRLSSYKSGSKWVFDLYWFTIYW